MSTKGQLAAKQKEAEDDRSLYMGHLTSTGLKPDPEKIKAATDMK